MRIAKNGLSSPPIVFRIIQRKLLLDGCVRQGGYVGGGGGRAATGLTARAAERHLDHPMEPGPRFKRMNEKLSAERAHGLVLILSYRKIRTDTALSPRRRETSVRRRRFSVSGAQPKVL